MACEQQRSHPERDGDREETSQIHTGQTGRHRKQAGRI